MMWIRRIRWLGLLLGMAWIAACSGDHFVEGTVVDYDTREPVAGVQVQARQTGWLISTQGLHWDHTYTFDAVTDRNGRFHLDYDVGDSAKIQATHDDYVTFIHWYAPDSTPVLKLKRKNPGHVPPRYGVLRLGVEQHRPFGWKFAERRVTFDPEEADVFPVFESETDWNRLSLTAGGGGGLRFVSAGELEVEGDYLVYTDRAPQQGYADNLDLNFEQAGGVYFVRTGDGRYAKFEFDPTRLATEGGTSGYTQGNWSLLLVYLFNENGSRYLKYER